LRIVGVRLLREVLRKAEGLGGAAEGSVLLPRQQRLDDRVEIDRVIRRLANTHVAPRVRLSRLGVGCECGVYMNVNRLVVGQVEHLETALAIELPGKVGGHGSGDVDLAVLQRRDAGLILRDHLLNQVLDGR